ncbi:alpha-1,2-fucosyltransferase [Geomonas sp. RF6]|uniref:alpha-1,2-fucosyltransferase n=1 Tax=Geomonas sp. RF6 TaxID=2897342 RepID=UPI001E65807C|nr:alpha-1,2-fucosyltransferase [Geomonas sp. RF6]UFS72705.1 alpha-1,2-fucosyltransferase [Geomonas sp. RF6]
MVIVRLSGGLGNQMFQYAAGRSLAILNDAPLKLDLGWFQKIPAGDTKRHYELHVFNTVQEAASPKEVRALQGVNVTRWPKVAKRFLARTGLLIRKSSVRERHFHFDPQILELRGNLHLDGYWQSPRYFEQFEDVIRKDFTLLPSPDAANLVAATAIEGCTSVSLHVRRGDYVSNPAIGNIHGSSSLEYYAQAVQTMLERVPQAHFFVFSDEPQWVKDNLKIAAPTTYLHHNGPDKGYEDLRLMTRCKHHIIANSSFSWWGAWLADAPGQFVIAPKRWFNRNDVCTDDLCPPEWLRL